MHLIKDENGNMTTHTHHTHEHTHDGSTHVHEHAHGADMENHEHTHSHDCSNCQGGDCKNETVALLSYMLSHNEHHAAELDQMAQNLKKLGMDEAAKQIEEGVSDFQKGNMRLSLALTLVKEQLKEDK
ncbi:MAG: cobalt transporter [Lachnospiraceae bacterium]|nr:cobalt transporter [Lachnospiraceae bacterium]MDD3614909.1 cobalt transporter [Lachnospiraceae bacterium]